MEKVITISIAAYNVEQYLEQCLDSLLIPNMEKIEVLIENDGSKDNTVSIAKRYEEKYPGVFYLVNKENGGYGSTINNSIRLANGKYFKQLDGDDWYDTQNFSKLVDELEHIDADIVCSPFTEVYEPDGEQIQCSIELPLGVYPLQDVIAKEYFLKMHGLAYKTELLRNHDVTILEHCFYTDQEYVIYPLLHSENVYVWDKPIYCYRLGREGQSVSFSGLKKHCLEHDRVIRAVLSHYHELKACHETVQNVLVQQLCGLIHTQYTLYMVMGDKAKEMKSLDDHIRREYPEVFAARQKWEGNRLRMIRLSGFLLYPLLRKKNMDN